MKNLVISKYSDLAVESLVDEVKLSPKPGLVDFFDNGSHTDMNCELFLRSAICLKKSFSEFIEAGIRGYEHSMTFPEIFKYIRKIGVVAEERMLKETNGVNTHKGAIFSFGLFLTSIGYYLEENNKEDLTLYDLEIIFKNVKKLVADSLDYDFQLLSQKKVLSHGEKVFIDYGIKGIRGEAIKGYPSVKEISLPLFLSQINSGIHYKYASLDCLLVLMMTIDDSNVIKRGDIDSLYWVKKQAEDLLNSKDRFKNDCDQFNELNKLFVSLNLSPGGAADLLAITLFLAKVVKKNTPTGDGTEPLK